MPTTEAKTLIVGADGYEYMIGERTYTYRNDVWTLASHFDVDTDNEILMYVGVVRAMFAQYGYSHIQDAETFGDDEPRTLRQWTRAYCHRFELKLPLWYQVAIRAARKGGQR